eukprot:PhF_6_TR4530/c0_g1_i1/m.6354/K16603/TTLL9; tubulin polyglutamylase TTLL9
MIDYYLSEEKQLLAAIPRLEQNVESLEASWKSSPTEEIRSKIVLCQKHVEAQKKKLNEVQTTKIRLQGLKAQNSTLSATNEEDVIPAGEHLWNTFRDNSRQKGISEKEFYGANENQFDEIMKKENFDVTVRSQVVDIHRRNRAEWMWRKGVGIHPMRIHAAVSLPQTPSRCVYGQGTTFREVLNREKWSLVEDMTNTNISLIWERDRMTEFRRFVFDPRRHIINRFPDDLERRVASKAELVNTMKQYQDDFIPLAYPLRNVLDLKDFIEKQIWKTCSGVWVLKRADLASGFGITIIPDVQQWWEKNGGAKEVFLGMKNDKHSYVFQKYVERPYLLTGRKFDARYFFLVASVDPLVVLATEGFMRLNVEQYECADWGNVYKHISNIAQNRTHPEWPVMEQSLLWTYEKLTPELRQCMWEQISRVITSIVRALQKDMVASSPLGTYQLFALDCLLDESMRLWVTECQINPALCAGPLSARLVDETLEVAYDTLRRNMLSLSLRGLGENGFFRTII